LEDAYIRKIRPHRSLKRYSTSNNDQLSSIISRHVKQGYLFSRITVGKPSRYSWVRRWFFLKDGWFGQCTISTVNKSRGTITINDRIPIDASCECRIFIDIDRRFCFQVNGSSTSFFLQAETELDMQQWLWAIERAKDFYGKDQHLNKSSTDIIPRALLSPKANTSIRKPLDDKSHILITLSSSPPLIPPITGPPATITSSPQATDYLANDVSTISAIITLMLKEGSSFINSTATDEWILKSSNSQEPDALVIWPNKMELEAPKVTLNNYSDDLIAGQRELRRYFENVPKRETVLDNQKYQNKNNSFNDGKGYTGTVYVTQTKLWFYSCRMMTCVNAIVIPFNSIKTIRLEKVLSANSQGKLMYIETKQNPSSVFCFGLWLNAAELIAERIRVATENAKRTEKLDDQTLFDILRCTTIGKLKAKTPTSHVTTISASNAAVTPLTVQAQSRLTSEQQAIVGYASGSEESKSQSSSSASSSLSDNSAKSMISATPTPDETTDDNLLDQKKQQQLDNMAATIPSSSAIQIPEGPVGCNCDDHLEKVEIDVEVPANVRTIYEFLVSTRCWEQLNKAKGNSVPNASNWEQTKTGTNERTLNYTMPNPMSKTKDADVIETQEILQQQHGSCYVMMITTKTPTLPYADAFIPMIKLCITFTSINSCRLVCSFGVKWLKSIMMKGMVNRAAVKGMSETITSLIPIVEQEASALQGKANVSGSANKQQMTQKERLTGIQEEDQVAAKQQSPLTTAIHGDTRQKGKLATSNILYRDTLLSPRWLAGFMGVALLFLLVNITWFTGRTRSLSTTNSMGNISWRAVHLTDLEPLVNGKDTEINRYNSR
ncbi:uncharacterized protein BX664DRAFT_267811, partial [Halteromyces radiatus]|uniref:uncharacterized protein n=1 Tax=Halteromyces radiatus TaxID=101107 RepID=UPI0022203C24